jgi:hypothetical protein
MLDTFCRAPIRIRPPVANSISTVPACSGDGAGKGRAAASGTGATATGLNATGTGVRLQSCCRHRNSWLVCIPASRATSEATTPGSSAAATIRSFSTRDHRRLRTANRGAAFWGNLVISPANAPARIVATDKETGKIVWETNVAFGEPELQITGAPLPIKDKIIVGASGSDRGVRDWIADMRAARDRVGKKMGPGVAADPVRAQPTHHVVGRCPGMHSTTRAESDRLHSVGRDTPTFC